MAIRMIEYDFLAALKYARKNGFEYMQDKTLFPKCVGFGNRVFICFIK